MRQKNFIYVPEAEEFISLLPTAAVIAPTHLSTTVLSPLTIKLDWIDNSDNETGFKIERKLNNGSYEFVTSVLLLMQILIQIIFLPSEIIYTGYLLIIPSTLPVTATRLWFRNLFCLLSLACLQLL